MSKHHDRQEQDQADRPDEVRQRLLAGLPISERRLRLAGISTAVLEGGEGVPVVLLHSSGEFAALWSRVIPGLVQTSRLVVPDLPGHGASSLADGPLDVERTLTWLAELLDHTCETPPVLVGRGLGGAIAARFAIREGHRLSQLVLVDSFGLAPFNPAASFMHALGRFAEEPTAQTRDDLFGQCFVDLDGLRERMGERWEPTASYGLERARTSTTQTATAELMQHLGLPAIAAADLEQIAVPTSLIWGRHDLAVRLHVAEAAQARYGWPMHVIEAAGDDPPMEQPAEFLLALQAAHVEQTSAEATR